MNGIVILFDLDDTLVIEYESAHQSIIATSEYVKNEYRVCPEQLCNKLKQKARELWHELPTYEYCLKIGISSWEGLWAKFLGDHEQIKQLNRLSGNYQIKSWHSALLSFGIDNMPLAEELSHRLHIERRKRHILYPEVLNILTLLSKDYRLGLITNGASFLQLEKINCAVIGHFF
jgi:FMN phosphatase YigB (HAD superfamily)